MPPDEQIVIAVIIPRFTFEDADGRAGPNHGARHQEEAARIQGRRSGRRDSSLGRLRALRKQAFLKPTMRLGEILIERKLITPEDLERALEIQKERGGDKIGKILVDLGFVAMRDVLRRWPSSCRCRWSRSKVRPPSRPRLETLSPRFLRQFRCLPVALHDHTVTLAMADPLDFETSPRCESSTGLTVRAGLAAEQEILDAIDRYYGADRQERSRACARRLRRIRGPRTPARHGERGAGHPPGERHDRAGRREARQRHPHRAVRKRIPHPLPHRRRAGESGTRRRAS